MGSSGEKKEFNFKKLAAAGRNINIKTCVPRSFLASSGRAEGTAPSGSVRGEIIFVLVCKG